MLKTRNAAVLFLLYSCISLLSFSQSEFKNVIQQDLYSSGRSIINGTPWVNQKSYEGHSFCGDSKWKKGEVLFNGRLYKDLSINYDIVEDEVIIYDNEKGKVKYIKLNKSLIERFTYEDNSDETIKSFIRIELFPEKGKEFYELAFQGKNSFFIKHRKSIKKVIGTDYMGTLYVDNVFYLKTSNGIKDFKSKSGLLKIIGSDKELKKYIREENLRINKNYPNDIVRLLKHHEKLQNAN